MQFFRKISALIVFSAVMFAEIVTHANAVVIKPQRSGSDGRFKYWTYQKNGVYYYEGFYMHPSYIQFEGGERLASIYLPKPDAWSIKRTENKLFLMPIAEDAETTMTVMTSQRTYFFELRARTATGPFDPDVTFVTRFRYNSAGTGSSSGENSEDNTIIQYVTNKGVDLSKTENYNFNYTVSGDYVITPIKVFDDGKLTYFEFRDKGGITPAIFKVDAEGFESFVNFRVINEYIAVEGISSVFTLRHGKDTVCVFNETMRGLTRQLTRKSK